MPHYKDGTPAQKGDRVTIEFEVREVYTSETACNALFVAVDPPEGEYALLLSCNTRFAEKAIRLENGWQNVLSEDIAHGRQLGPTGFGGGPAVDEGDTA